MTMNGTTMVQSPNIYFTQQQKLEAIAAVKRGERRMKIAHSLGITGDVVTDWLSTLAHQDWLNGVRKSAVTQDSDTLDRAVYTWYIQQLKADIHPTEESVTKKAVVFAMRLNKSPGHVNGTWVKNWMFRHSITLKDKTRPEVSIEERIKEDLEDQRLRDMRRGQIDSVRGSSTQAEKKIMPGPKSRKRTTDNKQDAGAADKPRTYTRSSAGSVVSPTKASVIRGTRENELETKSNELQDVDSKRARLGSGDDSEKENTQQVVKSPEAMAAAKEVRIYEFDLTAAVDAFIRIIAPPTTIDTSELENRLGSVEVQCKFVETLFRRTNKFPTLYRQSGLVTQKQCREIELLRKRGLPIHKSKHRANAEDDGNDAVVNEIIFSGQNKLQRRHLPPFGVIKRPDLKGGMVVYAAKTNSLSAWMLARVMGTNLASVDGVNTIVCKIRFENKKNPLTRICPPKLMAYSEPPNVTLPVGSRIVARYKEDTGEYHIALYAGVIAEPPKVTNNQRYLVFFDDGYAQYVRHFEVYLVCSAKKEVWEDINHQTREFIRSYLAQYPERPMVKLQRGQRVNTEWNGEWWAAVVSRVDASLVEMYFEADKRSEWIYRGSTRLEPLFNELARAKANKESGKPIRRHNTNFKRRDLPYVEYTRFNDDNLENMRPGSPDIEVLDCANGAKAPQLARKHTGEVFRQVARKSTTQSTPSPMDHRAIMAYRPPVIDPAKALSQFGHTDAHFLTNDTKRIAYLPHRCMNHCLGKEDPMKHRGQNPLRIPTLCGWQREITKLSAGYKRQVYYRAPCGRRLGNMEEVSRYLRTTYSKLTVDYFCFDVEVHTFEQFKPAKVLFFDKDITLGGEPVPVCCINGLSHEGPPPIIYSATRFPANGVALNLDPDFLCGCDCVDDCQNREKCQCQQLTVTATSALQPEKRLDAGYQSRRLMEPLMTGIYECNSRCKCKSSCVNRVAQNGLQVRLQMFKTEQRGWGIRCLDDIPQGMFICIYAGELLSEQLAIDLGRTFGDEYQAELDHIEVVECHKVGYETDAVADDDLDRVIAQLDKPYNPINEKSDSSDSDSDADFQPTLMAGLNVNNAESRKSTRKRNSRSVSHETAGDDDELVNGYKEENSNSDERSIKVSSSFGIINDVKVKDNKETALEVRKPMRESYFNEEFCYIMDAKNKGNIGRYLNHSCMPNVFVQNVFVDTHDLRFPWVAFFASCFIRAGKELTWDYNYEIGSVEDKVMYCYCGTSECRGRLL